MWFFNVSSRSWSQASASAGPTRWFCNLVVELQDLAHERGLVGGRGVLERHAVEHAPAEFLALRLAEHAGARLEPGEHAVPIEQGRREPVVVHDLGFLALGELEVRERTPDAQAQVLGRLVREGEAQHVARHHARRVDAAEGTEREVDHARGHHGGLARSGAGDQHAGFERPRDRRPLLVGGLGAHRGGDLRRRHTGAHRAAASSKTGCPSGNNGQSDLKSHQKQFAVGFGR